MLGSVIIFWFWRWNLQLVPGNGCHRRMDWFRESGKFDARRLAEVWWGDSRGCFVGWHADSEGDVEHSKTICRYAAKPCRNEIMGLEKCLHIGRSTSRVLLGSKLGQSR